MHFNELPRGPVSAGRTDQPVFSPKTKAFLEQTDFLALEMHILTGRLMG